MSQRLLKLCRELAIAQHVALLDEVGSTQDEALNFAKSQGPTLVIARHQTEGRGRMGRAWHETAGLGFACSVAMLTDRAGPLDQLSGRVGVAVAQAIESCGLARAWIKWPNDILDDQGRKLAGILIEIRDGFAVLGVGVNMLQTLEQFPPHARDSRVSLAMLGVETSPLELAERLVQSLEGALKTPAPGIINSWRERDALVGSESSFVQDGRVIRGIVASIDPFVEIRLRTPSTISVDPRRASLQ